MHNRIHPVLGKYMNYSHVIVVCHAMVIQSQTDKKDISHAGIVELTL